MNKPTDRTVFQNAWVVDDVEAACMKWVNEMGVGPFFITEYTDQFSDMTYRGEPAELSMFVAIAQAGPVQIEIIQPTVERCAYRDSVPAGTLGFHHMCVWTHDIKADTAYFAGLGYEAANIGRAGDIEFAYYGHPAADGLHARSGHPKPQPCRAVRRHRRRCRGLGRQGSH